MIRIVYSFLIVAVFAFQGKAQKQRLPEPINTPKSVEYAPSLTADGQTLIYQSDQYGIYVNANKSVPKISADGKSEVLLDEYETKFFGVYEAKLHPSGQWMNSKQIAAINEYANDNMSPVMGGPSISYDGNTLYFFANFGKSGYGREDIYVSERTKSGWSKPENIGSKINSDNYEGFPSVSPDGKKLYFTREIYGKKVDKKQCYRIMVSEKNRLGKWRAPYELPAPINMDCEKAPRILADGRTLVFSSLKKEGRGDFDLYKSQIQDDGSWSDPINLEFVNTKKSDQFVSVSPCGDLMYYVSNGDIYTSGIPESLRPIKSATIQGFVLDSVSNKPIKAKIIVKDASSGKTFAVLDNNASDGRYTAIVPFGGNYDISVNLPEYFTKTVKITEDLLVDCEPIPLNFPLQVIPTDPEEVARLALNQPSVAVQPQKETVVANTAIPLKEELEKSDIPEKQLIVKEETRDSPISKSTNAPIEEMELVAESPEVLSEKLSAKGEKRSGAKLITKYALILRVVNKETGQFIGQPKFSLQNKQGEETTKATTQSGNDYVFQVKEGDQFNIEIGAKGYLPFNAKIPKMTADRRVTIKLAPVLPSFLNILVLDAETGESLEGSVVIKAIASSDSSEHKLVEGKYDFELFQNDNLTITGLSKGYLPLREEVSVEIPENGSKNIDLELKLVRNDFELELFAQDLETGDPIPDAVFYVYDGAGTRVLQLLSDKEGKAKGKLSQNGAYRIELMAPGFNKSEQQIESLLQTTQVLFKSIKEQIPTHELKVLVYDKYTEEEVYPVSVVNDESKGKAPFFLKGREGESFKVSWNDPEFKPQAYDVTFDDDLINKVSTNLIAERKSYPFDFRFIDKQSKKFLREVTFKVVDLTSKREVQGIEGGQFFADLEPDKSYAFIVNQNGYQAIETKINALEWIKQGEFEKDIYLEKKEESNIAANSGNDTTDGEIIKSETFGEIKKGKKITLENIYFDQSSPVLREESFSQLDELVKVLKDNPKIAIEVRGHTDNEGDFYLNVKLSKERCESVISYLVSKGIDKARLSAVGRGPVEPIASNETEALRKKNRRVEFMVL